jgi:hypothetical protein
MLGHETAMDKTRAAKKFLENKPVGRRKVGRDQRLRWLEETENDS